MAIFTRFMPGGRTQSAQSDAVADAAHWQSPSSLFKPAPIEYDLVTQLTYMSALATANVGRENLFQKTAELGYTTSGYFHRVHLVAQRLNYDYARACQLVHFGHGARRIVIGHGHHGESGRVRQINELAGRAPAI